MNELEPILSFLSDGEFEWFVDEEADLCVLDPLNRYSEDATYPTDNVYMRLLNIDELHRKGLKESIYKCDFSEAFIDDLMFCVGEETNE